MTESIDLLSQGAGYGVLLGVGAFFALGIVVATKLSAKYLDENSQSTEMFMVANRNVGVGLTASAVYSSWTWATEFLWSVTMVYLYGVQSAFWYGAGLAVQICLMALLGIEAKKKIPASHTCLEIVQLRYGKACHILYMFLCLVNNLLSSSSMILGAGGAISAMCDDLHPVASTFLIPFGVLLYTAVGGLKSTFLTDFVHSFILLIILCYINTAVLTSEYIGGIDGLYYKTLEATKGKFIEGNYAGSYLTGKSQGAIFFGLIHAIGDTGLTVMDSSFWQKSFSSDIRASVPGYLIAAFTIFANVWPLGTIVGLANVILEDNPIFPTYPRKMTALEVNSGYGLIYTMKAVLGKGSLGALLLIIYLGVTSTVSAQMISVSSILSFDIYKQYINPNANNKQLINVSHFGVVFFGLFSAGFSVMLHYVGTNMTWMGYFYSMLICPGVFPMVFLVTWGKQSKLAFFVSPIIGMAAGLAVWLATAYKLYGEVTVTSTGEQLPCLYGSLTALFLPAILSIAITLVKPDNFDWETFKKAELIVDSKPSEANQNTADQNSDTDPSKVEKISANKVESPIELKELTEKEDLTVDIESNENTESASYKEDVYKKTAKESKIIDLYIKIAYGSTIFVLLLTWVVWPLPLYRDYIWSKAYFRGWTAMGMVWIYLTLVLIGLFPIYDGRHSLLKIWRGVWKDYIQRA